LQRSHSIPLTGFEGKRKQKRKGRDEKGEGRKGSDGIGETPRKQFLVTALVFCFCFCFGPDV